MEERKIILQGTYSDLTPEQIRDRVMRVIQNSDRLKTVSPPIIELEQVDENIIRFTAYEEYAKKVEKTQKTSKKPEKEAERLKKAEENLKRIEENIAKYGKEMSDPNVSRAMADIAANHFEEALEARVIAQKELERAKQALENPDSIKEEEKEIQSIQDSFEELKTLREQLKNMSNQKEREKLLKLLEEKVEMMEQDVEEKDIANDQLKRELQEIEKEILSYQEEMKEQVKEYEACYQKMEEIVMQKKEELAQSKILSEEERKDFQRKYETQEKEMNQRTADIKKKIELQKSNLVLLQEKKKHIEEKIKFADAFQLSVKEYSAMERALAEDEEVFDLVEDVYASLEEIILKSPEKRTTEEIQKLEEAKEKILSKIQEKKESIMENVNRLYVTDDTMILENSNSMTFTREEIENIIQNVSVLPEKIMKRKEEPEYIPNKAPEDMEGVFQKSMHENTNMDSITIFHDEEGNHYVRKSVLDRFHIEETTSIENHEGKLYRIQKEDYEFILSASHNNYSPYITKEKSFERDKKESINDAAMENANNSYSPSEMEDSSDQNAKEDREEKKVVEESTMKDKMVFYYSEENDVYYAKQPILRRFSLKPVGNPISVKEVNYYPLSSDDAKYIIGNANNSYSPYEVEISSYQTTKEDIAEKPSRNKTPVEEIGITLYQDLNHENQIYVWEAVLRKFKIEKDGSPLMIGTQKCYPISKLMEQRIEKVAEKSTSPKIVLNYVRIKVKRKEQEKKPSLQSKDILERLTQDLVMQEDDPKFFIASNIKVSEEFKKELQEGDTSYNIIHTVPGIINAGVTFLNKLVSKLVLGKRGKQAMTELNRRLNQELTEEECDVLLQDYRNDSFENTSQKYMNELVIERLKKHTETKLKNLNDKIEKNMILLYTTLKEISILEKSKNISEEVQKRFQQRAKGIVQLIEENQEEAKKVYIEEFDLEEMISQLPYLNCSIDLSTKDITTKMEEMFDYQDDDFVENYLQEMVVSSSFMNEEVKNQIQDLDNPTLEDFEIRDWDYQDSYRILEDEEKTFYNSFHEDMIRKMEKEISEYISHQKTKEEVVDQLSDFARSSQSTLVEITNESIRQMKVYAGKQENFDLPTMEEAMEYVIAHPNSIVDGSLSKEYQEILSHLPKEILSTIICSASTTSFMIETSMNMEKKKEITNEDISNMIDDYMKEKEESSKKKR